MTHDTQQPAAHLEPDTDARVLSLRQRMVKSIVAAMRPATQVKEGVQSSAKPFSIVHPWRKWYWFS